MQKIKLIIGSFLVLLLIGLGIAFDFQRKTINRLNDELSTSVINLKAYEAENDSLKTKKIQFEYTIDQLNHSKDTLTQKLNEARKSLKIKDKNIKELEYIASQNKKRDTVYFRDTIFRDEHFRADTLIGDEWASLNLHLAYPNLIDAEYSFKNEVIIVASTKKETIDPPKKFWICRLFQKKHTVTEVEVVQTNPYCEKGTERHIKIIE